MNAVTPSAEEIVTRGRRVYQETLRHVLEPAYNGQFAVINIDTAEFELAPKHHDAAKRARTRWPEGLLYAVRIGFPSMGHIVARTRSKTESAK